MELQTLTPLHQDTVFPIGFFLRSNYTVIFKIIMGHSFGIILKWISYAYMGQISYPYSISSTPIIHLLGAPQILWKKDIDQVKVFWASWWIWGTKVQSMPHHEFNVLADEILFFEAPVGYHSIWKNNNKIVI